MSKRPKLAYHQRTTASNNGEETSSVVEYEYTGTGDRVPDNVTHIRIHPSVTEIDNCAFHGKLNLKEAVLNEGLTVIGKEAFSNCSSLEYIKLSTLTELRLGIPSTVIKIDHNAFGSCDKLKEVVLNEGLQSIGQDVFKFCPALQSINIPSTVTEIGSFAFYCCSNLSKVVLSDGLKKIGDSLFRSCRALESITLPSTLFELALWKSRIEQTDISSPCSDRGCVV